MQANPEVSGLNEHCTVAVPIFHAYAHQASCQHKYSPRNIEGFGLTDGENIERLWSYLGRFAKMTKEMSSGNRIDLLNDALLHYCMQKEKKLGIRTVIAYRIVYVHTMNTRLHIIGEVY